MIRKAEERWGTGIVEQVSLDLQAAFPESKGFSARNLWRMKQWYSFYADSLTKLPQVVAEIRPTDFHTDKKLSQVVAEIRHSDSSGLEDNDFPAFFALVPWGHHSEIIAKCKTPEEALFYVVHSASEGWSRQALMNCIKADYYHMSGGAITNFSVKLPSPQSGLAQAITKDTYDFGFISLPDKYEEEELELELERQLNLEQCFKGKR